MTFFLFFYKNESIAISAFKASTILSFIKNKDGKSEDILTHLRNEIAHWEQTNDFEKYRTVGIPPSLIRLLLCILNDVICEKSKV